MLRCHSRQHLLVYVAAGCAVSAAPFDSICNAPSQATLSWSHSPRACSLPLELSSVGTEGIELWPPMRDETPIYLKTTEPIQANCNSSEHVNHATGWQSRCVPQTCWMGIMTQNDRTCEMCSGLTQQRTEAHHQLYVRKYCLQLAI